MNPDSSHAQVPMTACIITFNEADRIEDCIRSLSFCEEVLVIDSHSTDSTREKAAALGARVIARDWPGYRSQKEFAVKEAKHDWVLCLDADERATPEMKRDILALTKADFDTFAGFRFSLVNHYCGTILHHGNSYQKRKLRLFDRRRGGFKGYEVHETVVVNGPDKRLPGAIEHLAFRGHADQARRMEKYSTLVATEDFARGKRTSWLAVLVKPPFRFLRGFFLKLGFLDGWRGFVFHLAEAHYVRQKYVKLYLLQRGVKIEEGGRNV